MFHLWIDAAHSLGSLSLVSWTASTPWRRNECFTIESGSQQWPLLFLLSVYCNVLWHLCREKVMAYISLNNRISWITCKENGHGKSFIPLRWFTGSLEEKILKVVELRDNLQSFLLNKDGYSKFADFHLLNS